MNESSVYNETDLAPFHRRLAELRQIIHQDAESNKHPKAITKLLERQLNECGLSILSFIVYVYTQGSKFLYTQLLWWSSYKTRSLSYPPNSYPCTRNSWPYDGSLSLWPLRKAPRKPNSNQFRRSYAESIRWVPLPFRVCGRCLSWEHRVHPPNLKLLTAVFLPLILLIYLPSLRFKFISLYTSAARGSMANSLAQEVSYPLLKRYVPHSSKNVSRSRKKSRRTKTPRMSRRRWNPSTTGSTRSVQNWRVWLWPIDGVYAKQIYGTTLSASKRLTRCVLMESLWTLKGIDHRGNM